MKRFVGVKAKFTGTHQWAAVPKGRPNDFLQYPHRHVFNIEALFEVNHVDRDIEYFDAELHINDVVRQLYGKDDIKELGNRSCETVAEEIMGGMTLHIRDALVWIKVQEDNENYAKVMP